MDPKLFSIEAMLSALDVPPNDALAHSTSGPFRDDVLRNPLRLITTPVARQIWQRWYPLHAPRLENPDFVGHFRKFLSDGLELGYRLERFRQVVAELPEPDAGARNWISFFEEAVAGEDCCTVRMYLSREQHDTFLRVEPGTDPHGTWDDMLSLMTDALFYEMGIVYRPPRILIDDALSSPWFRCEWNDVRLPPRPGLDPHRVLVNEPADRLTILNIKGEEAVNPANGSTCATIDKADESTARQAGLTTWDSRGYAVLELSAAIRRAAAALVNRSLYDLYMIRLRDFSPDLVSILETPLPPPRDFVIQVLRGLLGEEISVRDLSAVLEGVLDLRAVANVDLGKYIVFDPPTSGIFLGSSARRRGELLPTDYVEFVRMRLKRYISHKYTRGGNTLVVYLMDPHTEEILARHDELDVETEVAILNAVNEEVGSLLPTAQNPVILTTVGVRRRLRRLVSSRFPHLWVVSYQELSPDMNIQPIARITPERSKFASM